MCLCSDDCFPQTCFIYFFFLSAFVPSFHQRWSRGHIARGQGQRHKTKSEAKDNLSEDRTSRGQGQECSRPRAEDRGPGHGMEWNGRMERKFRYGIWKMPEWNGRFQEWNGRQSSILPYQFHTRFRLRALSLQKNTYRCRVVINNIVTEVFNFNICAYYF